MTNVIAISSRRKRDDANESEFDALAARVIAVVAHQTGQRPERVGLDSEIERDLGCTGEDAEMLMGRMATEFGIDMRGLDFDRHFGGEAGLRWPVLVALVVALPGTIVASHVLGLAMRGLGLQGLAAFSPSTQFLVIYAVCAMLILGAMTLLPHALSRRARKTPITVHDLIEAARTRRWMIDITDSQVQ